MSLRVLLLGALTLWIASCDKVKLPDPTDTLTEEEIVAGLKEALRVSTDTVTRHLNRIDGYYGDSLIRILFPEDAWKVKMAIEALPGGRT
jgi:class 3 adenylate cyclase